MTDAPRMPRFSPSFDEGRYFDLWMLVHFVAGLAGGFSNIMFALDRFWVLVLAFTLMLAWELGEFLTGVRESLSNRVVDIVVGMVGVWLALLVSQGMAPAWRWAWFLSMVALGSVGMALGVRAYHRRKASAR